MSRNLAKIEVNHTAIDWRPTRGQFKYTLRTDATPRVYELKCQWNRH